MWNVLGALRLKLGEELGLIDHNKFYFLWVVEFPLLEWSDEEERFVAMHHPFTMPMDEDWHLIDSDPGAVRAKAYDIVLNGVELGGGSVRIHQNDIQEKMFEVIGLKPEEAQEKFGFLLTAFKYGVPPHAGLAYGIDRFAMLMTGAESIRDVMAFPKNKDAVDLMSEAPNVVDGKQLEIMDSCALIVSAQRFFWLFWSLWQASGREHSIFRRKTTPDYAINRLVAAGTHTIALRGLAFCDIDFPAALIVGIDSPG